MKTTTTVAVTALVVLSAVAAPAAGAVAGTAGTAGGATAGEAVRGAGSTALGGTADADAGDDDPDSAPPDPEEDVLGWEEVDGHGIWHNETIPVDNTDGINETELDVLVARTMARVEEVRRLEFEEAIPVEIRSREAYSENVTSQYANTSFRDRVHQNVKYEATFMIGEDESAIDQLSSNRASNVLGFYSPTEDRIVVISDNTSVLQLNEMTLSHELAHALQDQQFNITRYERRTEDENNAISGIVEGDAHYTEQLYEQRCNDRSDAWNGTCIRPAGSQSGGGGDVNIGVFLISFVPYSDGPVLVDEAYQRGGWEAVNEMYEDPPDSSEQVTHPEKYFENDEPTDITIEDRSNDEWEVLDLEGPTDHASFGEGGLWAMFWYPSYTATQQSDDRGYENVVVDFASVFSEQQFDAYNYSSPFTDGWDGDRLLPYVNGSYNATNETGYVWRFEWDTERDAAEFVDGYVRLLEYHGAESVADAEGVWRISDEEAFGDAFYVEQSGTSVVVVNAPRPADLSEIREGAPEIEAPDPTTTTDDGDPEETTDDDPAETTDDDPGEMTDGSTTTGTGTGTAEEEETPGFGVAAVVVAVLAAALLARRRR